MAERVQGRTVAHSDWTAVSVPLRREWTVEDSHWFSEAQEWCNEPEQVGQWAAWTFAKHSLFCFSDPDTAFAFKMRWC